MEAAPTISPAMGPRNDRDWWLTPEGHTMLRISGPLEFDMGSPSDEPGHEPYEFRHRRRIEHSFAISTCEVTIGQYRRFRQQSSGAADVSSSEDCPINHVSWLDAVAYCRWLSEQEQVPEQEMCYPPLPEIKPGFKPADDFVRRTGYRLPTEAETPAAPARPRVGSREPAKSRCRNSPGFRPTVASISGRSGPCGQIRWDCSIFVEMWRNGVTMWRSPTYQKAGNQKRAIVRPPKRAVPRGEVLTTCSRNVRDRRSGISTSRPRSSALRVFAWHARFARTCPDESLETFRHADRRGP
jgi:hypothetical protein